MTRDRTAPDRSSRRRFLSQAGRMAAAAGVVAGCPTIVPARLFGQFSPANRINVGAIGTGRISRAHDLPGIWKFDTARIVAVCDVDSRRVADAKRLVEESTDHHGNWLEAICTRRQPIAPIEIGHRSCSTCLLHHMAMKLGRTLRWDPLRERFHDDDEANAMLSRPQRPLYAI
jgi:hypothetical protein|nr:MAG: hypothetical protein DIU54_03020 [Acidobacteriota bacterium]